MGVNGNQVGVSNPMVGQPPPGSGPAILELLPGSPALDAGSSALAVDANGAPLTTDGRGMPRLQGPAVDIGAYEAQYFTVQNLSDSGPGSLRQAVLNSNASHGTDIIVFSPGLSGTIPLTSGQLDLQDSVSINGPGATVLSISGSGLSTVFWVHSADVYKNELSATISGLTLTGANGGSGGAIREAGGLTLQNCNVTSNQAIYGGAVYVDLNATLFVAINCTFSNNVATGAAGAIDVDDSVAQLANCTFAGDSQPAGTPSIYCDNSEMTLTNCLVADPVLVSGGQLTFLNNQGQSTVQSLILSYTTLSSTAALTLTGSTTLNGNCSIVTPAPTTIAATATLNINPGSGNAVTSVQPLNDLGMLQVTSGVLSLGVAPPAPPTLVTAGAELPMDGSGTAVLTVLTGGTVQVSPGATVQTPSLAIAGAASINLASDNARPATLLLGGDLTFASTDGTASIASTGSGALPGLVDLGGSQRSFVINDGSAPIDLSISAQLTDGAIRKSGPGCLQLNCSNTYAGGTTFADGTVEADTPTSLGTGPLTFSGGTLVSGPNSGTLTLPDPLTAAPTDSITLDVSGIMQVPGLTLGASLVVSGSGTLLITGPVVLQANCTIYNTAAVSFAAPVSGGFGFTKLLSGTLTLSPAASNTYTGLTTIDAGTLILDDVGFTAIPSGLSVNGPSVVQLQADDQINPSYPVQLNSVPGLAVLDLNGFKQTLGSLSDVNGGSVRLGSGKLTIGADNSSSTFLGSISGRGSLLKSGSGTLTLGGSNSYTGDTDVLGGEVVFQSPAALPAAASIIIWPTTTMQLASSASPQTYKTSGLYINSGGKLDLANNALSMSYDPGFDPMDTVRSFLASGYDAGKWDGSGIISSSAALSPSLYTLSYVDSADHSGVNSTANSILIRYGLVGDLNGDGRVNLADLLLLTRSFGMAKADSALGDFNFDGSTSISDFLALARNFGKTLAAPMAPAATPTSRLTAARRV